MLILRAKIVAVPIPVAFGQTHRALVHGRRSRCSHCLLLGLSVLALCVGSQSAAAEALKEALSAAYGYNPRLDAQRALQRAFDEDVARAMSGYRPTITGNANIGIAHTDQRPSPGAITIEHICGELRPTVQLKATHNRHER